MKFLKRFRKLERYHYLIKKHAYCLIWNHEYIQQLVHENQMNDDCSDDNYHDNISNTKLPLTFKKIY